MQSSPAKLASDCHAPLRACLGDHRHLIARCACGRTAPCDPARWIAQGLGDLPLHAFATRLRCVCGARQAELELGLGPCAPTPHPAIYAFR